jgi:hypothetical protein
MSLIACGDPLSVSAISFKYLAFFLANPSDGDNDGDVYSNRIQHLGEIILNT